MMLRFAGHAAVLILSLCGCQPPHGLDRSSPSFGLLPTHAELSEVPAKGYLVTISLQGDELLEGELLAMEGPCLWVQGPDGPRRVGPGEAREVRVELYPGTWLAWLLWGAGGAASSLATQGVYMLAMAPTWILTAAITAGAAVWENHLAVPLEDIPQLYQYARFPQGLPESWREGSPPCEPDAPQAPPGWDEGQPAGDE